MALADNQTTAVDDVLAVGLVTGVNAPGDAGELSLLRGHRRALEDPVVAASDRAFLVLREVRVLRDLVVVQHHLAGDPVHRLSDLGSVELDGSLRDDVAGAVPDQHLDGDLRVRLLLVGQVDQRAGDPVGHLVRVAGVDFFKHFALSPLNLIYL